MSTSHARDGDAETCSTDGRTYVFPTETAPTLAVLDAVASASEVEPTALPPLYDTIDPDALDGVFESAAVQTRRTPQVSFSYSGFDVVVAAGPTLTVRLTESSG